MVLRQDGNAWYVLQIMDNHAPLHPTHVVRPMDEILTVMVVVMPELHVLPPGPTPLALTVATTVLVVIFSDRLKLRQLTKNVIFTP